MKKSEILVGGSYSNGKGRVRKVVAIGHQYKLYEGQENTENLRYEIVHDGTKGNQAAGTQSNMTITGFASWAKQRVN